MSGNQQFYHEAYNSFENDVSIESIWRSLRKLESGLSAVIGNNQKIIEKSKLIYYSNQIVYPNSELHNKFKQSN